MSSITTYRSITDAEFDTALGLYTNIILLCDRAELVDRCYAINAQEEFEYSIEDTDNVMDRQLVGVLEDRYSDFLEGLLAERAERDEIIVCMIENLQKEYARKCNPKPAKRTRRR